MCYLDNVRYIGMALTALVACWGTIFILISGYAIKQDKAECEDRATKLKMLRVMQLFCNVCFNVWLFSMYFNLPMPSDTQMTVSIALYIS